MADLTEIELITRAVARDFRSFGGGKTNNYNPIAQAMKDDPPTFAAMVPIEDVVRYILALRDTL